MMSSSKRIIYIDALKCFAIYCVVWGHVIQYLQPINFKDVALYRIIYSFHMPLFMMISGYFASNSCNKNFTSFFYQKSYRLILPVLSFTLIFSVFIGGGDIIKALYRGYWFPKCLFLCFMA